MKNLIRGHIYQLKKITFSWDALPLRWYFWEYPSEFHPLGQDL